MAGLPGAGGPPPPGRPRARQSEPSDQSEPPDLAEALEAAALEAGHQGALSALARACVPAVARWVGVCTLDAAGALRLRASAHGCPQHAQPVRVAARALFARDPALEPRRGREGAPPLAARGARPFVELLLRRVEAALDLAAPTLVPLPARSVSGDEPLAVALRDGGVEHLVVLPVWDHGTAGRAPQALLLLGGAGGDAEAGEDGILDEVAARGWRRLARVASGPLALAARLDAEVQARAESEAGRQAIAGALFHLPDAFVTLDAAGRVTFLNPAAARLFGCAREGAVGRSLNDIAPPTAWPPIHRAERSAAREREPAAVEGPVAAVPGESAGERWLDVRAVPAGDGLSLYVRDVTARHAADVERQRLLAAAEAARAEAQEANKAKAEFLASTSHELRTPLNAVLGYVSLLSDGISGPVTQLQAQQLDRVTASARHLLALIEEILAFARLESERVTLHLDAVDAAALAREAAQLVEPVVESHGLRFETQLPGPAGPVVTDARKVRQILLNLLANAARFTPVGGAVSLALLAPGEAAAGDEVCFVVADTGIGIAAEHLERIFDPFWQVEQHKARRVGGSGLGLSVSRRYARLLGGDVTVESTPGVGSRFTLRLPRATAAEAPSVAPDGTPDGRADAAQNAVPDGVPSAS